MAASILTGRGQLTTTYDLYYIPRSLINSRQYPDFKHFIETLLFNGRISSATLVHGLIYLGRFHKRLPKRAIIEDGAKHKIFLAALLVASKFCDDRYPLSTCFVCGFLSEGLFPAPDVNRMERAFLSQIKYNLVVSPDELSAVLLKHNVDIKQIARMLAEKTNTRFYETPVNPRLYPKTEKPANLPSISKREAWA
ncbi:PHO85 cyclin-1 [Linderina pennispora]|nr:PHO85 cyclin-1 [Linderina pennispora]